MFNTTSVLLLATAGVASIMYINAYRRASRLASIPTVGPSGPLTSYIGVVRFGLYPIEVISEGLEKYGGKPFRVPTFSRWVVIVHGPKMVSELVRAPELSLLDYFNQNIQMEHTMGPSAYRDPYHIDVIRTALTRSLEERFPDMYKEIVHATETIIPLSEDWKSISVSAANQNIVCRVTNRLFVDLPTCREPDYVDLNIQFTMQAFMTGALLILVPTYLRGLVARFCTDIGKSIQRGVMHVGPLVQEVWDNQRLYGASYDGKPNNLVSWCIDAAEGHEDRMSVAELTNRVMIINVTAIHTTAMVLTTALYTLSNRPDIITALREEAEAVISEEGWSKSSMQKLFKLDSFIKESLRLTNASAAFGLIRLAKKDYAFSDGTVIPKGEAVAVAQWHAHHDPAIYPHGDTLDAFRFSSLDEDERAKQQVVNPNTNWLMFGTGRNICPGRHLALLEVKAALTHILQKYDVKTVDGVAPGQKRFFEFVVPDPNGKLMFRTRQGLAQS